MAVSLSITISQGSQSVANNTTVVSVTAYAKSTNGSYNNNSKSGTIVIDGTSYSFSSSFKKNTTTTLATKSKTVTHNSDGTRTVSASAKYTTGVSSGTISASGSKTLSTIPRASTMSCPSTFTTETAGTITLSRKSSSFTHTASCSLGNTGLSATSGIATSLTYTPPTSLFNSSDYAKVKSRTGTITVQTKSGSTSIGSALTQSITVNLPENSDTKPTCTLSSSISEVGSSYADRYGVLIAGKSKLQFSCSSSAKLSATIANHYFSIPGSSATKSSDNVVTTDYLTTSSSEAVFSYYVKDSRGFTSAKQTLTNPYKVVEYTNPGIIKLTAVRCNDNGDEDLVGGTKVKFKVDYYVDPIALSGSGKSPNAATIRIYKLTKDDDGNITSRTLLKDASGSNLTVSNSGDYTPLAGEDFPVTNSFTYEATIVDELTTTEQSLGNGAGASINTAQALLSFYGGDGLAMGKIAEEEGLDIAFDTKIKNIDFTIEEDEYDALLNSLGDAVIEITPETLINIIHPVGSVIANADADFDPNIHFGGTTWEKLAEGRVLMGANAAHAVGTTEESGLPNITGAARPALRNGGYPLMVDNASGAFYKRAENGYMATSAGQNTNSSYTGTWIYLDASRSNPIYGGSAIVQPPAYFINYWKRIA